MQLTAEPENRPQMPATDDERAAWISHGTTMRLTLLTAAVLLCGCARVPELEDRLTPDLRGADYPALVPLEQALTPETPPAEESKALQQTLEARAARLQARADALRAAQP
ncbi:MULTISPECIES: hypothetical protein [unclassified Phaeobacter]|uniref:hypothetical protein n=1 Tax=unclassified Phaeobacter TaxID=2621772 RepID=UPI003A83BD5A